MVGLVFVGISIDLTKIMEAAILTKGSSGLCWEVPGALLCVLDAMANAWILLVEINR